MGFPFEFTMKEGISQPYLSKSNERIIEMVRQCVLTAKYSTETAQPVPGSSAHVENEKPWHATHQVGWLTTSLSYTPYSDTRIFNSTASFNRFEPFLFADVKSSRLPAPH